MTRAALLARQSLRAQSTAPSRLGRQPRRDILSLVHSGLVKLRHFDTQAAKVRNESAHGQAANFDRLAKGDASVAIEAGRKRLAYTSRDVLKRIEMHQHRVRLIVLQYYHRTLLGLLQGQHGVLAQLSNACCVHSIAPYAAAHVLGRTDAQRRRHLLCFDCTRLG